MESISSSLQTAASVSSRSLPLNTTCDMSSICGLPKGKNDIRLFEVVVPDNSSSLFFPIVSANGISSPICSETSFAPFPGITCTPMVSQILKPKVIGRQHTAAVSMPQLQLQLLQPQIRQKPVNRSLPTLFDAKGNKCPPPQGRIKIKTEPTDGFSSSAVVSKNSVKDTFASDLDNIRPGKPSQSSSLGLLQASVREIHSYSVPPDQPDAAIKFPTAENKFEPCTFIKVEPGTVSANTTAHKGKTFAVGDSLKTKRSGALSKTDIKKGLGTLSTSEVVEILDRSPGSALKQLLLSDVGCNPNSKVVEDYIKSNGKAPTGMSGKLGFRIKSLANQNGVSRLQGATNLDLSSSASGSQKKNASIQPKARSPVIMEKKGQKRKLCKSRMMFNRRKIADRANQCPENFAAIQEKQVQCQPIPIKIENGKVQVIQPENQCLPLTAENLELAESLGINVLTMDQEAVMKRKNAIQTKLIQCSAIMPIFTLEEEFDVHCRAEAYVESLIPDPDYCMRGGIPLQSLIPSDTCGRSLLPGSQIGAGDGKVQPSRKRRRQLSVVDSCLTVNPYSRYYPELANCVTLSDGCQLLKPPFKLVELVAQAINDSPDGMLQVQQVYNAIQRRYPFFQCYDRTSMNSWRSSIRHALYQKWFRKIQFDVDNFNCKGCYWAINRRNRPKEWAMPPSKDGEVICDNDYPPFNEDFMTCIKSVELIEIDDEGINSPTEENMMENPCIDRISPTLKITDSGKTRFSNDPDPMMNQALEDEIDLTSCSTDTRTDQSEDDFNLVSTSPESVAEEHVDTSEPLNFDWQNVSDEGSYDSGVSWIPSFEDDEVNVASTFDQEIFLGFSDLPAIEQLEPEQMSMCLQKVYPHDEHW